MFRSLCFVGLIAAANVAAAQTICVEGRCLLPPRVVITSPAPASVVVSGNVTVSAQGWADHLAATGSFCHCSRRGGGYEGLGFGPTPDAACRRACYWGQRRVREIGTAWCPHRRGYVAVVRYE
jgi:hypothetical protein